VGYARLLERAAGLDRRKVLPQPRVDEAEAGQLVEISAGALARAENIMAYLGRAPAGPASALMKRRVVRDLELGVSLVDEFPGGPRWRALLCRQRLAWALAMHWRVGRSSAAQLLCPDVSCLVVAGVRSVVVVAVRGWEELG
jgi:hypothetical protein